jgi:hypothetical protein
MKCLLSALALSMGAIGAVARVVGGTPMDMILKEREVLQDIVSLYSQHCSEEL